MEGLGSEEHPFYLSDKYVEPPVENQVLIPVHVPAYLGGTFGQAMQMRCRECRDHQSCRGEGGAKLVPLDHDLVLEERSLESASVGHPSERSIERMEGFLREVVSEEEKNALVETHKASVQTLGAGLSIPNNAGVLDLVLYRCDTMAHTMYQEYLQQCAKDEARCTRQHAEGYEWVVDEDEHLSSGLDDL